MSSDAELRQSAEREFWNQTRAGQTETLLAKSGDVDYVRRHFLRPCYEGLGDLYSENRMFFHDTITCRGGWQGKHVLDYGCGIGNWSLYFAQTGARSVVGFDIAEVGIESGRAAAERLMLSDRVTFHVMDATKLELADDEFDLVIGTGILHHTIKYPGIFEHLWRVMKPGTQAFFLENLADFLPWRLWWKMKGEVPEGDVPIFSSEVRAKAGMFERVEIIGDTFLHVIKRVLYKPNMGPLRRNILRASHNADRFLFRLVPSARRFGSMSVIVLTKQSSAAQSDASAGHVDDPSQS